MPALSLSGSVQWAESDGRGVGMNLQEFAAFHLPALAADEIRFNVQIAIITAAAAESPAGFSYWTLGAAGQCATMSAGHAILLGNLNRTQCEELAHAVSALPCPGVVGAGETAHWFAGKARQLGAKFHDAIPQCIYFLPEAPRCPAADGFAREATAADSSLLFEWMSAFHKEAVPHDPPPEQDKIDKLAAGGRCFFWMSNGRPVSVAAVARRLANTAAIAPVYTPPEHRARGFGGSITAAIADRLLSEGKRTICLYANLRNPASNRCYEKIGFKPYCESWHYLRDTAAG